MSKKNRKNNKNRYKFSFGEKQLTLTTDKDNLFMEEVERLAHEKYDAIKDKLPHADDETVAILMAINTLSKQLERELAYDDLQEAYDQLQEKWDANQEEDEQ